LIAQPALIVANQGDTCRATPPGDAPSVAAALAGATRKEVVFVASDQIPVRSLRGALAATGFSALSRRSCTVSAIGSAPRRSGDDASFGLCLVTGANGFVGSAVARVLLKAGHPVRVLARPRSDRRNLKGLSVEIVQGSLEDAASLAAAVAGCRYLFHVAADYRLWVPDPGAMFRANVEGTRELMLAALAAGVDADRLYQQRRDAGHRLGWRCRRRDAEPGRGHDRPL